MKLEFELENFTIDKDGNLDKETLKYINDLIVNTFNTYHDNLVTEALGKGNKVYKHYDGTKYIFRCDGKNKDFVDKLFGPSEGEVEAEKTNTAKILEHLRRDALNQIENQPVNQ